jgi:hypothetical protein
MRANEGSFGELKVVNSNSADVDFIFKLFDSAIDYQKKNGYELWPQFSKQLIETEIAEKRHWKLLDGETIVCIFSILYKDPVIWQEKDHDPSVYLHRIAINPAFKGKGIMKDIKAWAMQHAVENDKKYVRMDTWGHNASLRSYYINCGFNYIGQQHLKDVDGRPVHYGGSVLSLFQIEV